MLTNIVYFFQLFIFCNDLKIYISFYDNITYYRQKIMKLQIRCFLWKIRSKIVK